MATFSAIYTISMIYLSTREILQNMDIFKENSDNFSKFS